MEMQVFITNLGKYNEGEIIGSWLTPMSYNGIPTQKHTLANAITRYSEKAGSIESGYML